MAKKSDDSTGTALTSLGTKARKWAASFLAPAKEITQGSGLMYGASSPITVASLLTGSRKGARIRRDIYGKWQYMEGDAIVSAALSLLVTSALGGNEATGDLIFIEPKPEVKGDKQRAKMVEEIAADLSRMFNKVAYQIAYTGATYGDAYARIYADNTGVIDLYTDELVRPQLVQPYERGSRTVGYAVYVGEKSFERLDVSQLARMKMPRVQWVPQQGVVEKSIKLALTEDNIDALPIMPSMAGGSLLFAAEEAYDNLNASLLGLVGQRWMDSIDEQMLQVNLTQMTDEQQDKFIESIATMLGSSKKRAEDAVKNGRPVMERIRHIIPVFNEKQLTTVSAANGGSTGRTSTITIEDVMMHARLLAGSIGVDLSMLGFADQMAGGLGEGGWFRTSAQAAERARVIRVALEEFFNGIIDIHTMRRYGVVFGAHERPWEIQFYGSISALESERQKTRADAMNAALMLAQGIQLMKDMGANKKIMELFLTKSMLVDEEEAKVYAEITELMPKQPAGDGFGGPDGGGGFGGGGGGFGGDTDDEPPADDTLDSAEGLAELLATLFPSMTLDSAAKPELGPEFKGYRNNPEAAIDRLMREKRGHVKDVVNREGIGPISLVYGDSKGGLKHIAEKHPEEFRKLGKVLKRGRVLRLPGDKRKAFLFLDGNPSEVTIIALDWMQKKHAWVVTSYDDHKGGFSRKLREEGVDATGARVDTAGSRGVDGKSRHASTDPTSQSVPQGSVKKQSPTGAET
ncbi:MAG TPA: hypothetical protein VIG97_07420 [Luteimonas sp.]